MFSATASGSGLAPVYSRTLSPHGAEAAARASTQAASPYWTICLVRRITTPTSPACRSSVDRLMSGDLPRGQGVRGPGRCTMPHGTLHPHMVLVGRAALPIYTVPPKEYP